ncbi:MAG: dTMP kinase [Candidatus Symbiobacter sp.]|nr:dTMP kinase [Candidatus Symbiobacter sp.]
MKKLMVRRSFFISFEGGDGAGKTSQISHLSDFLQQKFQPHLVTREPGGIASAESIRALLMDANFTLDAISELFLFMAARREHWLARVAPALAAGQIVLCDRFSDSTFAYQVAGRGLDRQFITLLTAQIGVTPPDLTFILDLPVEMGLARSRKRAAARGETPSRHEKLAADFHERVRQEYLAIAAAEPERCVVLDACLPEMTLAAQIAAEVAARLSW